MTAAMIANRTTVTTIGTTTSTYWPKESNKTNHWFISTHFYYPAVRTGSSNTHFVSLFISFFGAHLPQTSGFPSAKQILIVSSATQVRAHILSDRNIFCILGEGQQRRGLTPLRLFLLILHPSFHKLSDLLGRHFALTSISRRKCKPFITMDTMPWPFFPPKKVICTKD